MNRPTIEEVQERHQEEWMTLPGVVGMGVGICGEEPCIRVFLCRPSGDAEDAIPERVEAYLVELETTGSFGPR